ncbi:MAG: hypothetical protein J0L75_11610 [Spirochaetes bacterium]|nr:hypothetical protein [Spirochaetota bacterium]
MSQIQAPKKQGETALLFERILLGFGEDYLRNLKELSIHPEHKDSVGRLLAEYPGLFGALAKAKTKYIEAAAGTGPIDLPQELFDRLTVHLEAGKRIVVKLLSENRSIIRPFWHVLKENCTYMSMVVAEIRRSAAANAPADLPTLDAEPEPPPTKGLTFQELVAQEAGDPWDLRRYENDAETMRRFLAREAKTTSKGPGKYQHVLQKGYVTLEEFRGAARCFELLLSTLKESLDSGRLDAMPRILLDQGSAQGGTKGERVLLGPLIQNGTAFVSLLRATLHDVPCHDATEVFFTPGCQYLKELHLALGHLVAKNLAARDLFSEELSQARRECVDHLKQLGKLISRAELEKL